MNRLHRICRRFVGLTGRVDGGAAARGDSPAVPVAQFQRMAQLGATRLGPDTAGGVGPGGGWTAGGVRSSRGPTKRCSGPGAG